MKLIPNIMKGYRSKREMISIACITVTYCAAITAPIIFFGVSLIWQLVFLALMFPCTLVVSYTWQHWGRDRFPLRAESEESG